MVERLGKRLLSVLEAGSRQSVDFGNDKIDLPISIIITMTNISFRLFVVDDDPQALDSIGILATSLRIPFSLFTKAEELLARYDDSWLGCLLIDLHLGGINGLELQQRLRERQCRMPVILISAYADVRSAVRAMNLGAISVLEKPYDLDELTSAIRRAIDLETSRGERVAARAEARQRVAQFTPRERQVMRLLVECVPRKLIARQIGLSLRTVERLCARVYALTGTGNPVALARFLGETNESPDAALIGVSEGLDYYRVV